MRRSFQSLILSLHSLFLLPVITHGRLLHQHAALNAAPKEVLEEKRQNGVLSEPGSPMTITVSPVPSSIIPTSTTPPGVLTYVTPSPGAEPIAITSQSQVVESYAPLYTICPLATNLAIVPRQAYYANHSAPAAFGCQTEYSTTETTVCHTTLYDFTTAWTVTVCSQDITFASEYGFTVGSASPTGAKNRANATAMITAAPSITTLTTFHIADWQSLTQPGVPPSDITDKVCHGLNETNMECIEEVQVWHVETITQTSSFVTTLQIATTISEPAKIIVETLLVQVVESATTYSLSTEMEIQTETETESIVKSTGATKALSGAITSTKSRTVEYATPSVIDSGETSEPTTTIFLKSTRTVFQTMAATTSSGEITS